MTFARWAGAVVCAAFFAGCVSNTEKVASQAANPPLGPAPKAQAAFQYVRMSTTLGDIVLELDYARAPLSVTNFLYYVEKGAYNGTIFHRVVDHFVVQGGGYTSAFEEVGSDGTIRNEWQNGLKNVRGSIGMARDPQPDTATRQFYINLVDNPKLDTARETTGNAGYAVFGRVIEGMDVVDRMGKLAVMNRSEELQNVPVEPPVITRVTRGR